MLDVHAPHQSVHTWKDFFIHIATIVIGLIIAVGLEQSVEAIHRRHEVAALRENLHAESLQILADARRAEAAQVYELDWLKARIAQAQAAVFEHRPIEPREPSHVPVFASPDIPIWRSAKAGTQTPLLTKGEVNAYSEVEYVQIHLDTLSVARIRSQDAIRSFNRELPTIPNDGPDFTKASPQDLRTYLTLLTTAYVAVDRYLRMLRVLIGAELAVIDGKTSLDDLYASERKTAGVVAAESL
jgi:hypothetical protein